MIHQLSSGRLSEVLSLVILLQFIVPQSLFSYDAESLGFLTAPDSTRHVSIAVLTLQKRGVGAKISEEIADQVRESLSEDRNLSILSKKNTAEILRYHRSMILRDTQVSEAEREIEKAKRAHFNFNTEEALQHLDMALRLVQERVRRTGDNDHLIDIRILRAYSFKALDRKEEIEREFLEIAKLDPNLELDPKILASWAIRAYEVARESVLERASGVLRVNSEPKAAHIFINGVAKNETPQVLTNIPTGTHTIKIVANNYIPVTRQVTVGQGEEKNVTIKLVWNSQEKEGTEITGFEERDVSSVQARIKVARAAGLAMKVRKILFVSVERQQGKSEIVAQLVDVSLGTAQPGISTAFSSVNEDLETSVDSLVAEIRSDSQVDLIARPEKNTDRAMGQTVLLGKRRSIFKSPWFWVGMVALTGTGVGAGIALTGGAAAAVTGGVVIGL